MPTLLCCLLALPLASAVMVALLGPRQGQAIRWISLACTVVCLVLAITVSVHFVQLSGLRGQPSPGEGLTFQPEMVPGDPGDKHVTTWTLVPVGATGIQFYIGIDGLNVWLIALTALLLVPSVLVSWTAIEDRVHEFYAWLLVLETGMLGVFLAFDIILFYVFFELTLVPLFFLIGIWGGPQRQYAARKFFIFTLAGSLITLLGVLGVVLTLALGGEQRLTFSIPELVTQVDRQTRDLDRRVHEAGDRLQGAMKKGEGQAVEEQRALESAQEALVFWRRVQFWVFAAMMVGFAIKVPLVPVHTWLPLAHTEAPTAGSVLLAGVLLKIGTLRLPPVVRAAGTRGGPQFRRPAHHDSGGDRYPVRGLLCPGPAGHQEAGGLQQRQPPGLLHAGHVRPDRARPERQPASDDQPRAIDRGALPPGRHALRTLPHAQDGRLRRHGGPVAPAGGVLGLHHSV
jgi:NADH-quinone oxidoreductase subunit M